MQKNWKLAAGAVVTMGLIAIPASASAAGSSARLAKTPFTITTTSPFQACYLKGESITIPITGGTPGDEYEANLTQKGNSIDSGDGTDPFDATGSGSVTISDVVPDFSTDGPIQGVSIIASIEDFPQDGSTPTTTPIGTFEMTQLAFDFSSTPRDPALARSFSFSGAFPYAKDYAFITNNAGTKVLKKFVVGRSNACGYVRSRAVIAPPGDARGTYRFWIYPAPHLVERASVYEKFQITRRY